MRILIFMFMFFLVFHSTFLSISIPMIRVSIYTSGIMFLRTEPYTKEGKQNIMIALSKAR